jgi:glycosyltransferase involved in cell wall biosynthesis
MPERDRILLDARLAVRGLGIGTFIDRLMGGFAEAGIPAPDLWGAKHGPDGTSAGTAAGILARSGLFDLSPRLDPRTRNYDVVHFACNVGPVFPGRASVVTVHDLLHRRTGRTRYRVLGRLLELSMQHAGQVVAVSANTRDEVVTAFPGLKGRVQLIPHGMRRLPVPAQPREHILSFGGAADPRKRIDLMVDIYGEYRTGTPDPLPLVVLARAGLTRAQRDNLERQGAHILDNASAAEVDDLMGRAAALLYTSIEEGFGLPILEAAELGTPVVMDARATVATEVVGAHCVMVEDGTVSCWGEALRRATSMGVVPAALDLPGWPLVAAEYRSVYRKALGDR